jgi:putative hydrolase
MTLSDQDPNPLRVLQEIPGIGPKLADRLHRTLGVDSLEAFATAVRDGRLDEVEGIGPDRAAGIRAALRHMMKSARESRSPKTRPEPDIETILEVDREYRRMATADTLPTIPVSGPTSDGVEVPRPILHAEGGPWVFTAMYTTSARSRALDRTRDWVVIIFADEDGDQGRVTVVTERRGPLASKRVVRGREMECVHYYARNGNESPVVPNPSNG